MDTCVREELANLTLVMVLELLPLANVRLECIAEHLVLVKIMLFKQRQLVLRVLT